MTSQKSIDPTPIAELESALKLLSENKRKWIETNIKKRVKIVGQVLEGVLNIAPRWVEASSRAKRIEAGSFFEAEEWLAGVSSVTKYLRLTLQALKSGGHPRVPCTWTRDNGQKVAQVYPMGAYDALMLKGVSAELWMEPGKDLSQGQIYRQKKHDGKIALVLGAGNQSSIPLLDSFYKLLVDDEVVLLKMNPVNEYLGPLFEEACASLIREGFLRIVYGGADVGDFLCCHQKVDSIHITGSVHSHDAIVWGQESEREERKARHSPRLSKPITSELGCVTPIIVVPGEWSEDDIDFQAQSVLSMIVNNSSYNCNAAKVIVTAKDWPQREPFLAKIRERLSKFPTRFAYYPGSVERHQSFLKRYAGAKMLSPQKEGTIPWTFIPNVPPIKNEFALTTEAFCGVFGEVCLDEYEPEEFLRSAVKFANDSIFGTLSCGILIDPATEIKCKAALESAVENLKYGGVAINAWPALIYWLMSTTWGGFPGYGLEDVQSGRGVVHNACMFDYPQKSVLRSPFRPWPKPIWFANHKNALETAKRVAYFEAHRTLPGFVSLLSAAVRG